MKALCAWTMMAGLAAVTLGCPKSGSDAGCTKDSDCKGDRICSAGQCQAASAASASPTSPAGTAAAKPGQPTGAQQANAPTQVQQAQGADSKVCGLPLSPCANPNGAFNPWDLTWHVPVGSGQHMSKPFFAIILESVPAAGKNGEACGYFSEGERTNLQNTVFTQHKVFASRFGCPGPVSYTAQHTTYNFVAVYGGETQADAQKVLDEANATGKFNGANIRSMQAIWNQP